MSKEKGKKEKKKSLYRRGHQYYFHQNRHESQIF